MPDRPGGGRATRVLFHIPDLGPLLGDSDPRSATGGAETQVLLLAIEAARRGMRPAVAVRPDAGLPREHEGVAVVQLPGWACRTEIRLVGKLLESVGVLWTAWRWKPDVIVQRMASTATAACAISARILNSRFVWSAASIIDFDWETQERSRRDRALLRYGVRTADRVVVQSDEQARMCRDAFGVEARVIRSIVEPAPAPGPTIDPPAVIWASRLVDYKRPLDMVDLARLVPGVRVLMVAVPTPETPTALVKELKSRAEALGNLEVLEPMNRAKLLRTMSECIAVVSTSEAEGMPNIFLEGWARGLPAVCLHHDPDGIIEKTGAGISAHGNLEACARYIEELAESKPLREDASAMCRKVIEGIYPRDGVIDAWVEVLG